MISALRVRSVFAFLARRRGSFVLAIVVAVVSSGTATAVSSLILGTTNTATNTTTLKSGDSGAVVQLTNTNTTHGSNARGLGITVPAGHAPISVNASAGKATNLDADKLDGLDSTQFAQGGGVTTLANRRVLADGDISVELLTLPGLGVLKGYCGFGESGTAIVWINSTSANIDMWFDLPGEGLEDDLHAHIVSPTGFYTVAEWVPADPGSHGHLLVLGQGNDPGARRTATVTLAAYRSAASAPCGLQATATIWSTP